jgi:hypothetical protein
VGFAVHLFTSAEPRFLIPVVPVAVWLITHTLHRQLETAPVWRWRIPAERQGGAAVVS